MRISVSQSNVFDRHIHPSYNALIMHCAELLLVIRTAKEAISPA